MKIIILPGYSLYNKDWAESTADYLKKSDNTYEVYIHKWQHWLMNQDSNNELNLKKNTSGNKTPSSHTIWNYVQKSINITKEIEIIRAEIGNNTVHIIAKSVGTKVLMSLLPECNEYIKKVVMCGLPIDPVKYAHGIKMLGEKKLLIIQNSQDPFMPYKLISMYIKLVDKKIKVIEKKARNHDYPYYKDFYEFFSSEKYVC